MKLRRGTVYVLEIPEGVSSAIGRRGPVPIVATLNETVEIQASMVPMGGGRHGLQLNAPTRGELDIEPGDRVRFALWVPEKPPGRKTARSGLRRLSRWPWEPVSGQTTDHRRGEQ